MVQVAGRFDGPTGVDVVILSLPNRMAEAISTMMENIEAVNSKVRKLPSWPHQKGVGC